MPLQRLNTSGALLKCRDGRLMKSCACGEIVDPTKPGCLCWNYWNGEEWGPMPGYTYRPQVSQWMVEWSWDGIDYWCRKYFGLPAAYPSSILLTKQVGECYWTGESWLNGKGIKGWLMYCDGGGVTGHEAVILYVGYYNPSYNPGNWTDHWSSFFVLVVYGNYWICDAHHEGEFGISYHAGNPLGCPLRAPGGGVWGFHNMCNVNLNTLDVYPI